MTHRPEGLDDRASLLERYRRQLAIDGWGEAAQAHISRSTVTVIGAGGLGSPVLFYLTAAGIGHLKIIDGDMISLSNLNRQILYGDALIGLPKAEAAGQRLTDLNPTIEIETFHVLLTPENTDLYLPTEGIIVDCLDNFETRFIINRHAVEIGLPLIHAGVEGFYGQLTTIIPEETACLECIFAGMNSEKKDDSPVNFPAGPPVLGAAVGTIGCLQALEVLKLITGIGTPLKNRLLIFDGMDNRFDEIPLIRNDNCPVCGV